MKIIHSDDNRLHFPQGELFGGELVTPFERPSRVEIVLNELKRRGHRDISAPGAFSEKPVRPSMMRSISSFCKQPGINGLRLVTRARFFRRSFRPGACGRSNRGI